VCNAHKVRSRKRLGQGRRGLRSRLGVGRSFSLAEKMNRSVSSLSRIDPKVKVFFKHNTRKPKEEKRRRQGTTPVL